MENLLLQIYFFTFQLLSDCNVVWTANAEEGTAIL